MENKSETIKIKFSDSESAELEVQKFELSVYHIELSDKVSGIHILNNILNDKQNTICSCVNNEEYLKGLYFQHYTNYQEGLYCSFIYSPDGKLHCLSNDYFYAHKSLIMFVFDNDSKFDGVKGDFFINGYWDSDRVVITTFMSNIFTR